ncbi:hypothetical protein Egran_03416 [Elaphomyces granulatus]|uniref:USP domain-containing protein n=1 Tax=Elaphomyces granulatus TaxID=519963 RepID=A0A232LXC8_9EURO|nr:hypothetical protein Egran_03416 [Elaphomyces granulatus]
MSSDAAALPNPSSAPSWAQHVTTSSSAYGMQPGEQRASRGGQHQNGDKPYASWDQRSCFPHIKDLQDEATLLDVDENSSLQRLLESAQDALQQCTLMIDRNQLDMAYVYYLRACEITVNIIPRHPDHRSSHNQPARWSDLKLSIRTKQATMDAIKHQILEDNLASNIRPKNLVSFTESTTSSTRNKQGDNTEQGSALLRMPSPTDFQTTFDVQPKQENFPRQPIGGSSAAEDILVQRFARLGNGENGIIPMSSPSSSHSDYPSRLPSNHTHGMMPPLNAPSSRPMGPRNMGFSPKPPPLPTTSLGSLNASLPRAPSPTYSPTRTMPSQPPSNPPRTSTESVRMANPRYSQFTGSPRGSPSRAPTDENPYRSRTPNGIHTVQDTRGIAPELPHSPTIKVTQLLDYMQKYNILLIDVRPRDQYDNGHVYAKSIICIEPVALKENISAEELEERLVVSPEHEQSLFEQRNEFDLIVYYDQNTDSVSYIAGSPVGTTAPHLRALYDTLYEFNAYKPLKDGRPPALLQGGLDAWIDLFGEQSLATSSTAAVMGSLRARRPIQVPGRPIGRVPMASANSSLEVRKRRLREYTPLNPEELSAWMEQSKKEEIETSTYEEGEDSTISEEPESLPGEQEPLSPFVHNYEDFLRRFPEPHAIQQSMMVPEPRTTVQSIPNYAAPVPITPLRPPPALPRPSYGGVSDGRQIQPTLARQNSATRTALYTPNSMMSRLRLPRTGLVNFGVTCYMNATIQCMNATMMLGKFFLDGRFRYYVQKNWKGSQGVMPGLYANLIRSLWKNDVEVIIPTSFRNFCGRLNREWAIDRQQDAKEFFDFVVDCLHEDLNINWQRNPLRPLTFEEEIQRERMSVPKVSKIEWDRYCHREESFISSLFAGQHASRLRCTSCKRTSTTYEAFYSISVEIPPSGSGNIYQCLRSYCQEEMLSGDEVWKCPYCKCERVATKQIIITRAPQILVVHFKRFSASKSQSARKIHTPIDFPLYGLRMDDFVIQYPSTAAPNDDGASPLVTGSAPPSLLPTSPPFTYDAYAVLRHLGSSLSGGHYISLVKDQQRQCWRKFDDERVSDFNPRGLRFSDRLQNEQAYIIFFERVPAK